MNPKPGNQPDPNDMADASAEEGETVHHVHLAHDLARAKDGKDHVATVRLLDVNLHGAREQDVKAGAQAVLERFAPRQPHEPGIGERLRDGGIVDVAKELQVANAVGGCTESAGHDHRIDCQATTYIDNLA